MIRLLLLAPSEICAIIPYRDFPDCSSGTLVSQVLRAMAMVPRFAVGGGWVGRAEFLASSLVFSSAVFAQTLMPASGPGGVVRLFTSDAAILEAQEIRKDIPCTATPVKPVLGFDLKFHAGYDVSIPLKELAGSDNQLTMVLRVTPEHHSDEPVYFSQHFSVPMIEPDAGGNALLSGNFDMGEGKYHVDWLMRDRAERICSSNWDLDASLPGKDKQMALDIPADAVQPADTEPFKQEPPVSRAQGEDPLNVKV